jgi:predicted DNA-binding transcriptional regulator AlpA
MMSAYQASRLTLPQQAGYGALRMAQEELAGLAEVATLLGVTKRTAQRYTHRADFPEPISILAATPVWRARDIAKWKTSTLPLLRDPRKKQR